MNNQNAKKAVKWGIICALLTVLTIFSFFIYLVISIFKGEPPTISTDTADYRDIFELAPDSGLLIFPEELTEGMKDIEFYYKEKSYIVGTPLVSIYLQVTYSTEDYINELERLQNIRKVYCGEEKTLLKDNGERFAYPAYLAIDNHRDRYEYVLFTGENQITYIYNCIFDAENLMFDAKYLPKDFEENGEELEMGYSLYLIPRTDTEELYYDTTREEYVTVEYCYAEKVENSYFIVRMEKDEQGREMIQQCEFCYFEPATDREDVWTFDLESDDTIWTDLKGYEFRNLELSKDRSQAIVTYFNGAEEKEWVLLFADCMPDV